MKSELASESGVSGLMRRAKSGNSIADEWSMAQEGRGFRQSV